MTKPVSLESFLWLGQLGIHDKQGRSFRSVAIKLTVPKEIMDMSLAEGIQMYSASHVETAIHASSSTTFALLYRDAECSTRGLWYGKGLALIFSMRSRRLFGPCGSMALKTKKM